MELVVLFLISCIITARFLEKRKMRAAAVLYSVMFISVLAVFFFAVDIPLVETALKNVFGAGAYYEMRHYILEAINMSFFGVSMVGVIALTIAVQITLILVHATKTVVRCFIKKAPARRFKKLYFKSAPLVQNLYLPKRINLIYCRMLN